jgi:hypothetical protein
MEAVMLIGHIGLGLAAKKVAPAASLGVLLIAAEAADVLWGVFMVAGIEQMRSSPGFRAMSSLDFIHYPRSHGLVMTVVWSVLGGPTRLHDTHRLRKEGKDESQYSPDCTGG